MTHTDSATAAGSTPFGPAASIPSMVRYRGELAQQGLRLTRFLVRIGRRDQRTAFMADEASVMNQAALSHAERAMVRQRDYPAMLAHGVNIYALAKAAPAFGHGVPDIGRAMRAAALPCEGGERG